MDNIDLGHIRSLVDSTVVLGKNHELRLTQRLAYESLRLRLAVGSLKRLQKRHAAYLGGRLERIAADQNQYRCVLVRRHVFFRQAFRRRALEYVYHSSVQFVVYVIVAFSQARVRFHQTCHFYTRFYFLFQFQQLLKLILYKSRSKH